MFWKKKSKKHNNPAQVPQETIVYAIGDIHGNADLLDKMHAKIFDDTRNSEATRKVLVYLGDYIDRGFQSKEVVDRLINNPMEGFEKIYILGNHEDAMLTFLKEHELGEVWLVWGGDATISSYGVVMRDENGSRVDVKELSLELKKAIPEDHMKFYKSLSLSYVEGDYIFVHAGLKPGVPIEKQTKEDMTTIRDEFIFSRKSFEKTVVFGHTIFTDPFFKNNRIGVDTGAYASGKLSAVVLEGESVRFLDVTKNTMDEDA